MTLQFLFLFWHICFELIRGHTFSNLNTTTLSCVRFSEHDKTHLPIAAENIVPGRFRSSHMNLSPGGDLVIISPLSRAGWPPAKRPGSIKRPSILIRQFCKKEKRLPRRPRARLHYYYCWLLTLEEATQGHDGFHPGLSAGVCERTRYRLTHAPPLQSHCSGMTAEWKLISSSYRAWVLSVYSAIANYRRQHPTAVRM